MNTITLLRLIGIAGKLRLLPSSKTSSSSGKRYLKHSLILKTINQGDFFYLLYVNIKDIWPMILLLQKEFSHPGAHFWHWPNLVSHVLLSKQFPLQLYRQLGPNVPLIQARKKCVNNYFFINRCGSLIHEQPEYCEYKAICSIYWNATIKVVV